MRFLISFAFLLTAVIIPAGSQDLPANKTERKVVRLITNLPEIVADNKYMTKKGRPYLIYIENKAGDLDNCYHVAVSEYNGVSLVPHYRFLVEAKTYRIYYVDFWNDNFKPIPLNVWRKRRGFKVR
jgi:hypothetical protein